MYDKIHSAVSMRNYDSGVIMKIRTERDSSTEKDLTQIVESLNNFYNRRFERKLAQEPRVRQDPARPGKAFFYNIYDYFDQGKDRGYVKITDAGLDERELYRKFMLFFNPRNEDGRRHKELYLQHITP